MAEKGKKKSGGAGDKAEPAKQASVDGEKKASVETEAKTEAKDHGAAIAMPIEKHGEAAASAHHAAAHGHPVDRREYFIVFGVLFALTVLEVVLANPALGIARSLVGIGLVGMAIAKASLVGYFYMHLKHDTKVMKLTVAIPMATPAFYALVLVTEAAWRLTR
ncbi:MAG: cytochrome C oxidase subunit IV family protein [Byssovorax sp.]